MKSPSEREDKVPIPFTTATQAAQTPSPKKLFVAPVAQKPDNVESPEKPLTPVSEPPSQMEGVALFNTDPKDPATDMRTRAAATEATPVPMEVDGAAKQDASPEAALKKAITTRLSGVPEDVGLPVEILLKDLPGSEADARK
eukprot:5989058-Amphidinium_carterae.1